MTHTLEFLRRVVALLVAITFVIVPIALAQSPESAPPSADPASTALLSNVAFARLVRQRTTDVAAPAPVVTEPPRLHLLRPAMAARARSVPAAPAPARQQRSWVARHKVATGVLIGLGVVIGGLIIAARNSGCGQDNSCLD